MRRFIAVLVLIAAAALPADAMAIPMATRASCGTSCGAFQTSKGAGYLRSSAKGIVYGTVSRGQIWMLDRQADGLRAWSISGYERGPIVHAGGWREFRGRGMTFSIHDRWSLRIVNGVGINIRIVADGNVTIRGQGLYALNGSSWRAWSSYDRYFSL